MPIAIPLPPSSDSIGNVTVHQKLKRHAPLAERVSREPTPVDVISRVASFLADDDYLGTVSALHRSSKELYFALSPVLYRSLDVKVNKTDLLLTVDQRGIPNLDQPEPSSNDLGFFSTRQSTSRRLASFRHVRQMIVRSLPSDNISEAFALSVSLLPFKAFPHLNAVTLLPDAVDGLRTWVPASYGRPSVPPFLEGLTRSSSVTILCIRNRVILADDWEEHRDATVLGQYQVVSRINRLKEEGWPDLTTLEVHNIVHQVLPSLPNCRNIYHFSSHITGSQFRPIIYPPGPHATYLPGPQWSYRAWQLGTAIKNLFPSGVDAEKAPDGTSWEFVNTEGHVLTKMVRDDDDESGVGFDEVLDLIKGAVKDGLPQDLPLREGFDRSLIGQVFEKINYAKEEDHPRCRRSAHFVPVVSSLKDIS